MLCYGIICGGKTKKTSFSTFGYQFIPEVDKSSLILELFDKFSITYSSKTDYIVIRRKQ